MKEKTPEEKTLKLSVTARNLGIIAILCASAFWLSRPWQDPSDISMFDRVLGILSILCLYPANALSVIGLITSIRFKKRNGAHNGNSMAGMVLCITTLVVIYLSVFIAMVFFGVASPPMPKNG